MTMTVAHSMGIRKTHQYDCKCGGYYTAYRARPVTGKCDKCKKIDRLHELQHLVREQWRKYDEALGVKPYVAIVQIDAKLGRLHYEMDALEMEL